jgi:hypothetical protein
LINLARQTGVTAKQSSVYYTFDASKAIDGNTDGNFAGESCTHTNAETNPWW